MRIYLVGFMGVGKTFLGKELAHKLGYKFIDLDELVVEETGKSIPRIFEEEGETQFRQIEAKLLRQTAHTQHAIIATGGGAPCFHENMDWMNDHGITLHLQATISLLTERLSLKAHERPLLAKLSELEMSKFIEETLLARSKFYQKASIAFDVPSVGTEGVEHLANYLKRFFPK